MHLLSRLGIAGGAAQSPDSVALHQRVWVLSAPALIEMVLLSLVGALNMMIVGGLGSNAIAAVGITQQPFFFAMAVIIALNVGTTAIVARCIGAGQTKVAQEAFRQNWVFSGGLGLLFGALFFFFATGIVTFMGGTPEVLALSASYLRIISFSIPLFTLSSTALAALRGAGDTRTPMFVSIVSNSLIVVLGFPLVYGFGPVPACGVAGVGWALVGARVYMVSASFWAVVRRKSIMPLNLKHFTIQPDLLQQTFRISLPSAAEQALLQAGLILFVRAVTGMGTVTYAAHQIMLSVLNISWQPSMGFAVAATTLAGQCLGAGKPDEAEAAVREAQRIGLKWAIYAAALLLIAGKYLLRLYTADPQVIREAASVMQLVALIQPAQAITIIQAGGLRGAGATRLPLLSTVSGIWIVRTLAISITVGQLHMGLMGAWIAVVADQLYRFFIVRYLFNKGTWKSLHFKMRST